jgi:Protein of unknown function (DUF2939)
MNRKLLVGAAGVVLAVALAAWAVAPILAGHALIKAAEAGDARKLERLADFPALRTSLKEELNHELARRFRDDPRVADSGLGGLGYLLAPMILSGAVDTVVTPEVIAQMVTTAEAPDPTRSSPPEPGDEGDSRDIHQSWGYRDLNHFAVTLTDRDRPEQHLALILERRGLFSWKLAAVDLQAEGA